MSQFQLYAVTSREPQPLAVPPSAVDFADLYTDLSLGVYSVFRTFDHNKFLWLDHHLARTVASMQLLGWTYELDEGALRQALHTVCTAAPFAEMRVRIDVLAAPATALGTESRVLVALMPFTPLPASYYEAGVAVGFVEGLARQNPRIKTAAFVAARKAQGPTPSTVYEQLMTGADGVILEGVSSNFYGFRQGTLYTAGAGVLEGITRRILLDLATQAGIPVKLEPVYVDAVSMLDEAAISSSSRGLLPVVMIEGQPIGNGRPGPLSRRLMRLYDDYVVGAVKTAVE
jgi:branched-chain amino acid aminotransferase